MNKGNWLSKAFETIGLVLALGVSMSAYSATKSWKEEVLLHDGSKIIVERSVERVGRHEIGQQPPIKEQSLTLALPNASESITWRSKFSEDVGFADFQPLLLDIFQGSAYVVTHPVGCLSYNKWGRPNPPYVIFKYQNKAWQRITIQELPAELKTPNLIFSSPDSEVKKLRESYITIAMVQQANSDLTQSEFKTILREPYQYAAGRCQEMVPYGKNGWLGLDWFSDQPTYEACSKFCEKKGVSPQSCPCENLFKEVK